MSTVTISKEVIIKMDVDVYRVRDSNGDEIDFVADVDNDGDIIIELADAIGDLSNDNVRDHLGDEDTLTDFINDSCDTYCEVALQILLTKPKAYEWLKKHVSTSRKLNLIQDLLSEITNTAKDPV